MTNTLVHTNTNTSDGNGETPSHFEETNEDISDGIITSDSLPQHIQLYIEHELLPQNVSFRPIQITNVVTFRSAQQQIYLVQLGHGDVKRGSVDEIISILSSHESMPPLPISSSSSSEAASTSVVEDAIRQGNNYIVIKIWTGTSRWWNCHHIERNTNSTTTASPTKERRGMDTAKSDIILHATDDNSFRIFQEQRFIAQQEIGGYQTAHHVFTSIQNELLETNSSNTGTNSAIVRIPRVLYSSIASSSKRDDTVNKNNRSHPPPWCILEYVGPYALYFCDHPWRRCDTSYIDAMIPIRMEFGFEESHLRWGRLPIHLCVPYTLQLLNSFLFPLHLYYYINVNRNNTNNNEKIRLPTSCMDIYFYTSMIELVKSKLTSWIEPNITKMPNHNVGSTYTAILKNASQMLKTAIDTLYSDQVESSPMPNLGPVLCHMDLQPQNLIFGALPRSSVSSDVSRSSHEDNDIYSTLTSSPPSKCQLLSVLDWEETAYADPRFELLLLCRKVCANREQADYIWQYYNDQINERLARYEGDHQIQLGSIIPWLKLEAMHSITTILLECVAGGGRGAANPCLSNTIGTAASKQQMVCHNGTVLAKMQREFQRLHALGFTFCNTDHWCVEEEMDAIVL